MYRKINGRYIRQSGNLSLLKYSSLEFTVRGPSFLNWLYVPTDPNSPTTAARPNGYLLIRSTKPNKVTISYGDGVVITYPFIFISAGRYAFYMKSQIGYPPASVEFNSANYDNHIFTDGNTNTDRKVFLNIQDPDYIVEVASSVVLLRGTFPSDIDKFPLKSLQVNYALYLDKFPDNTTNIKTLQSLILVSPTQVRLNTFPETFLGLTDLLSLTVAGVFNFEDPIASGLFKLGAYGYKLNTLSIASCRIGITQTDLPIELLNLTGLLTLDIGFNNFLRTPNRVGQMTSITGLILGGITTENVFNDWGDFSGLVNLSQLRAQAMQSLPTTLPVWFNTLTKLKIFATALSYHTITRQNTFVDNLYTFIVANAAKTGANTLPFRGMSIVIYAASAPSQCPRPSGTYQAPTGYIAGISNGTPVSQMEKIWVMTNQYNHTWTINPS